MGCPYFGDGRLFEECAMGIGVVPGQRRDGDGKIFVEVFFREFRPALFCVGDDCLFVHRFWLRLRALDPGAIQFHHRHRTRRRVRNLGSKLEGAWWTYLGELKFGEKMSQLGTSNRSLGKWIDFTAIP